MVLSNSVKLARAILLLAVFLLAMPCYAQYTDFRIIEELKGDEPLPRAILWNQKKRTALVHYKDQHMMVCDGLRLDKDWLVKEIKRESIVFGKNSEKRFIEIYLDPTRRPRKIHYNWSFYGLPITIWETLELLADGFGKNAVMNGFCTGAVTPHIHGSNMMEILNRVIPENHRSSMIGDTLYVFPVNPPGESWANILTRIKKFNNKALVIRYPGLAEKGTVKYVGDDIQYVLRVISLGGKTPITFPKNLHFAVYACYKDVPFSKILCDIVYSNQCVIAEREFGLEIIPWLNNGAVLSEEQHVAHENPQSKGKKFTVDPEKYDEVTGASGPYPPPFLADPSYVPSVVLDRCASLSKKLNTNPIIVQPQYQGQGYNKEPAEVNFNSLKLPKLP